METSEACGETNLSELTLLQEGSLAKTLASLDSEQVLPGPDLGFGSNTQGSFAWFDRDSLSWRTWQLCLSGEWEKFSEPWPASGLMRNGQLLARAQWVRHICDEECSLWPTPTASMDGRGFGIPMHNKSGRFRKSIVLRVQDLVRKHGWRIHPNFTEALMNYPKDWTEIKESETECTHAAPSGSGDE